MELDPRLPECGSLAEVKTDDEIDPSERESIEETVEDSRLDSSDGLENSMLGPTKL
jgi:hypothetical protein